MKQKTILHLLLTLGSLIVFSGTTQAAGNPADVKSKISMCIGCHGIPGYRTSFPSVYNVPKIGGQHEAYIVKALEGYQSGTRSHPSMDAIAKTLSQQDIADLAAYYSKN